MSDEAAAISGVTHGLKTLVDDSVNLTINIPPRYATECMKLFGKRGIDIALAALTIDAGLAIARAEISGGVTEKQFGDQARKLKQSGFFRSPDVWCYVGKDDEFLTWLRGEKCASENHDCLGDIVPAHVRRVANGSGTGIKPMYSAIALCDAHHKKQHQLGESAIGPEAWWSTKRIQAIENWCWFKLKTDLGYGSWAEVPPAALAQWAEQRELETYLPTCYKEAV